MGVGAVAGAVSGMEQMEQAAKAQMGINIFDAQNKLLLKGCNSAVELTK